MLLLREIFNKKFFDKDSDIGLKYQYEDFFRESNRLKKEGLWDEFEAEGMRFYRSSKARLFVFLSHSHKSLRYTMGLISFLRNNYDVFIYIDGEDKSLPAVTSLITTQVIKKYIAQSDRFLFLASNGAIDSKWCNWELGIGDVLKYPQDKLAFIAWHDANLAYGDYKGHEYMEMYPLIVHFGEDKIDYSLESDCRNIRVVLDDFEMRKDVHRRYWNNRERVNKKIFKPEDYFSHSDDIPLEQGWYVRYKKDGHYSYKPLDEWLR
jgi:hypothetical protein